MTGDTIAALATARGTGALAVVRLSGPDAFAIVHGLLRPAPGETALAPHCVVGRIFDGAAPVDRVVAWFYRAPRSYTGEDVVEIGCHGGAYAPERVLHLLLRAGARPARGGEFTLRAFLNGKLDLAQAEAVEAMITARSGAAARAALRVLDGDLRRTLTACVDRLSAALADVEATLDIQEDGAPDTLSPLWRPGPDAALPPEAAAILRALGEERDRLARLLQGGRAGSMIEEGLRVVLAGRPNAGKSSIFNALLARDRAIVAADPGTTRDLLEGWVEWDGLPVVLVDTAGLREAAVAPLEAEGMRRAREALAAATLVVLVADVTDATPASATKEARALGVPEERIVVALHKWDLGAAPEWVARIEGHEDARRFVPSSVLTDPGVEPLRRALLERLRDGIGDPEAVALVGRRQRETLTRAHEALEEAIGLLREGHGDELVAFALRRALDRLGEILGVGVGPRVMEEIFARFCVGK
jgi:tRNA modification GTPase